MPGMSCGGQPRDVIVGLSYTSSTPNVSTGLPTLDPYLWKGGKMIDLGNLGGTISGLGGLIPGCTNHRGEVIGVSNLTGDLVSHAFFWYQGVMTDLGTLGGSNSEAIWLNEAGDVVGSSDLTGNQTHHAALWTNGHISDLGTIPGDPCSRGYGLNNRGQVVGSSTDCFNLVHAFLWEEGGPMLDLNTLIASGSGYQLISAFNINDRGEILAIADSVSGNPINDGDHGRLVLLVPCDPSDEDCDAPMQSSKTMGVGSSAALHSSPRAALSERPLAPGLLQPRRQWIRQHEFGPPRNP